MGDWTLSESIYFFDNAICIVYDGSGLVEVFDCHLDEVSCGINFVSSSKHLSKKFFLFPGLADESVDDLGGNPKLLRYFGKLFIANEHSVDYTYPVID